MSEKAVIVYLEENYGITDAVLPENAQYDTAESCLSVAKKIIKERGLAFDTDRISPRPWENLNE